MWNDPIVEETRRLRDEFAKKHNYSIRAMVEDLKQWEQQGFPLPNQPDHNSFQPNIPPLTLPQQHDG